MEKAAPTPPASSASSSSRLRADGISFRGERGSSALHQTFRLDSHVCEDGGRSWRSTFGPHEWALLCIPKEWDGRPDVPLVLFAQSSLATQLPFGIHLQGNLHYSVRTTVRAVGIVSEGRIAKISLVAQPVEFTTVARGSLTELTGQKEKTNASGDALLVE